ncbi:hypothetical protein QBC34DRAFT_101981 [Podospora aff. communis PSN243]|uniref:Endo-1,3(4)-beta-glucanase 1 carbohydrate binding domain-containing protein n=1 Tax=Podospora aff. communis PSN243 TaxID=3040156 RepID=A0AAV9GL91_9PEZI|nr:hypothetical protein QBC34DRAFT_101981 [Podospora aff. communis PSN243]
MGAFRVVAALAVAALLSTSASAEEAETCGTASYFPSEYSCYNNTALCPKVYGLPTVPCAGAGGCYSPHTHSCSDGALKSLPPATSAFTLTAWGVRTTYQDKIVKACGGYLAIGANARECTACDASRPGVNCASYGKKTVLMPDGSMAVDVNGGQYWYVDPRDGALRYTEVRVPESVPETNGTAVGWNATTPLAPAQGQEFAGQRVTVTENGLFEFDSASHYWFACLRTMLGGVVGTGRTWRIYSSSPMNVEGLDCEKIKLVAKAVDRKEGAYQYQ